MATGFEDDFDFDEEWGDQDFDMPNARNARYRDAYGGYAGGYPAGPIGPPRPLFGPRPPRFFPPPLGFRGRPPFPPRPMGPPMFGPRGPPPGMMRDPKERHMRFLMKCGLTKEFVKKIPKEILLMCGHEHCGLCSYNFQSFALSRIHYNSKAHLNAQKKWISQRSGAQGRIKEQPIKARELYCELCDVQITSKVHGDSHYSGKAHRAIVEGRKVSKNPMLLQPGSERRFQQLIRREKKALSKKEEGADGAEETTSVVKAEPKPIIPELYCEICKTAVTCSEQMTMHMNGKKHLSKEKQHILKMMRGVTEDVAVEEMEEDEENVKATDKVEDDQGKDGQGNGVVAPPADDGQGNGVKEPAADDQEWGTGDGGDW